MLRNWTNWKNVLRKCRDSLLCNLRCTRNTMLRFPSKCFYFMTWRNTTSILCRRITQWCVEDYLNLLTMHLFIIFDENLPRYSLVVRGRKRWIDIFITISRPQRVNSSFVQFSCSNEQQHDSRIVSIIISRPLQIRFRIAGASVYSSCSHQEHSSHILWLCLPTIIKKAIFHFWTS